MSPPRPTGWPWSCWGTYFGECTPTASQQLPLFYTAWDSAVEQLLQAAGVPEYEAALLLGDEMALVYGNVLAANKRKHEQQQQQKLQLPEGSKRGGRAAAAQPEEQQQPGAAVRAPPKKRRQQQLQQSEEGQLALKHTRSGRK